MATYELTSSIPVKTALKTGDIITCAYSGSIKSITFPGGSILKFTVIGAKGGNNNRDEKAGGKGGISIGTYSLGNNDQTLYLCCGGAGSQGVSKQNRLNGGYNGGGSAYYSGGSGAGATHIATANGILSSLSSNQSSVLIVAGGGGGACGSGTSNYQYSGGYGGGSSGGDGSYGADSTPAYGGTQSAGGAGGVGKGSPQIGTDGSFGQGGSSAEYSSYSNGGGGGGGWYGGGGGGGCDIGTRGRASGGGGGSGYVSSVLTDASTTGNYSSATGNGYITIECIKIGKPIRTIGIKYNGTTTNLFTSRDVNFNIGYGNMNTSCTENIKHLSTKGKMCTNNITVGNKTLQTNGKFLTTDITVGPIYNITEGYQLTTAQDNGTSTNNLTCVTGWIPVQPGCASITWHSGSYQNMAFSCLKEYRDIETSSCCIDYWNASTDGHRVLTGIHSTEILYVRATFILSALEDSYLYDNTHGVYLWRGSNI